MLIEDATLSTLAHNLSLTGLPRSDAEQLARLHREQLTQEWLAEVERVRWIFALLQQLSAPVDTLTRIEERRG